MMKILFSSLLILLAATLARAQDPNIQVVLPYKDGFLGVGSGGENVAQVWASKDGRKFDAVQRCKGLLLDAVVAGPRLVVATSADGLYVIALDGSWRTEHTPVKDQLLALASDGQHALALSATKQWRLSADGKWSTEALWLPKEGVASRLAFGRGVWVVAGKGPAEDANGGGPTRIAWSVDGQKWESAKIEAKDARGVMALAVNAQGFLAITGTGDGLFSAEGNVWRPAQLPGEPFSSELFTAAGKFWLLERADRSPHRLRSSVDGKTWTSSENLPMEMRAQFLIEKDGQAWIFGTDAENFGVIARADQPHEPAAPVPVTVAQAPQPATVTTPAPVVSPAKPALPVTTAPASAVAGTNNPIAVVAAALAEFDRAMHVASPGEYPRAGITLLKTLRANASAHPSLPAFTDAMRDAIGLIVEMTSGLPGYYELVEKVDDKDVKPLMNRLSQEKRDSIRKYAGQVVDAYARAQANRTPVPDKSQIVPTVKWPTLPPAKKGEAPQSTVLDIQRVYERIASGERGAVVDLAIAHWSQISVPGHGDLIRLWAEIYNSLGGPRALFEDLQTTLIKPETVGVLAQDGSAICQFFEAKRRSEKTPIEQITDEDLALCEKSAAGGYRPAVNYVKQIKEARAGKPETKPATAADWFKAAEAVYKQAATPKIEYIDPEKDSKGQMTMAAPSKEVSDAWGKAAEALEAYGKKYAAADECLKQAEAALRKGDADTSRRKLEEGLTSITDHPGLLVLRARLYALSGNLREADKDLNAVIQKVPQYAEAHGVRAMLRFAQRDWEGTRQSAEAALKLTATQPHALLALAQLDVSERKAAEALAKLERNVVANPDFDEARFLYGMLLAQTGKTAQGIQEFETLCQRNPYATAARQKLILYYVHEANKPDEARRHVNEMIKINHPDAKQFRDELEKLLATKSGQKE